jgi:ubiquinone biosynthesis protein
MPHLLARGSGLLDRLDSMARNGLVLAPETIAEIGRGRAHRNRWTAVALWIIAALLGWIGYALLR